MLLTSADLEERDRERKGWKAQDPEMPNWWKGKGKKRALFFRLASFVLSFILFGIVERDLRGRNRTRVTSEKRALGGAQVSCKVGEMGSA